MKNKNDNDKPKYTCVSVEYLRQTDEFDIDKFFNENSKIDLNNIYDRTTIKGRNGNLL